MCAYVRAKSIGYSDDNEEGAMLYGVEYGMNKADRLRYGQTMMTHAMLFTGVDVVGGKPRRWRVENSWGTKDSGEKGY